MRALAVVLLAVMAPPILARTADAASCAAPAGAGAQLGAIDAAERLAWIDARLGGAAHAANVWRWGWTAGIGGGGLASLAAVPFVTPTNRVDWYTGAVSSAIGVVPFLVAPLSVIGDAPKVHASRAGGDTRDLCVRLADAEAALARGADNERWQRGWWVHAGNVAFNAGVLLFLGLGYQHWLSGLANGVAGLAVGEAIIFTSPLRTVDDLASYRRGDLAGNAPAAVTQLGWTLRAVF